MKRLTAADVEFEIECLPEETAILGNASAIDPETDAETEQWIYDQLAKGNDWAWCCVRVTARWRDYSGVDYLGACSYLGREDFERDVYCADVKDRALDDLNEQLAKLCADLKPLCEDS
jgi:hypothetical protein